MTHGAAHRPDGVGTTDPSIDHLLGRLDVVRQRVAALVAARRAVDTAPDDPFLGLYLPDEKVDALLRNDRIWVDPTIAAGALASVEAAADLAETAGAELRLRRLTRRFALDEIETDVLLTALAPDVDERFERYYGYLNDDVTRRRVSVGLALGLSGVAQSSPLGRRVLHDDGVLVGGGLLVVDDPDRPLLTRDLRVPDRVTAHLLGADEPDPALATVLVDLAATGEPPIAELVRAVARSDSLVYLHDRHSSAVQAAVDAAVAAGVPTIVLDLENVATGEARSIVTTAVREARLAGGALVAGPVDSIDDLDGGAATLRLLTAAPVPVVLSGHRSWEPSWATRAPFVAEPARITGPARARMWREALGGSAVSGFDASDTTAAYRLGPGQIRQAAAAALVAARLGDRPLESADVHAGARQQNAARLERLARRIEAAVSWADLVLPPNVLGALHGLTMRARHRELVLGEWRMRPGGGRGTGVTALFAGDSGTGKTMSAEVIASDLGLDLYVVNLATVVDKYIGETEKNLDRIFAEADGVNGVLLFDEADALFGQRSEVHDSHDRYANIEVAYLLQRMETFDGLTVLSTNLRSNIDDAFTRRLDVIVDFPIPDPAHRRRLWDLALAPLATDPDVDLGFCAEAFELTGGHVRSIAVTLGYRAAATGAPLGMADVVRAVGEEYRKLGRLTLEAEFGRYHAMLRP